MNASFPVRLDAEMHAMGGLGQQQWKGSYRQREVHNANVLLAPAEQHPSIDRIKNGPEGELFIIVTFNTRDIHI